MQFNPGAGIVQNGAKAQFTWCNEPELFFEIHVLNAEGPFFAWIIFGPEIEVQSWDLPQDVTIIDPWDISIFGERTIELQFPPGQGIEGEDLVQGSCKLRLKKGKWADVLNKAMKLMAFYDDRDQYGYPINFDIEQVSYGLIKSAYLEGSGMLVSELIADNEKMVVPGFNAQSYQWAVEGDLTFDVDYWWDGPNSVFYMKEGSRINVESNVTFYNMSFLSCDNWWESIVVRNDGLFNLAQQGNRPKIKDAVHGIRLMNHSRAYLDGVDFEDNFIGIHSPSTSNGSAKNAVLSVRNSKFTENNYIIPPFISPYSIDHPYAAIELNDVHSTWLNECPSGPLCGNLIEKMYHGIILRNVDASLQGFIIRNLYDDPNDLMAYANTGIIATSGSQNQYHSLRYTGYGKEDVGLFQDLGIGIHLYNTEGVIKDTRMEGVGIGIQQMGGIDKRLIVESNKVFAKNYGILSSFNQNGEKRIYDNEILHYQLLGSENATMPVQIGIGLVNNVILPEEAIIMENYIEWPNGVAAIYSLNNSNLAISENTIYGGTNESEYGIKISGGNRIVLDCNLLTRPSGSVDDPSAGIYIQMMDGGAIRCNSVNTYPRGIEYFGMSQGSLMEANTFTDHRIGLLYDHEAETGLHYWSGNRWTSEYQTQNGEIGARNTSDVEAKIDLSKYYVDITPFSTHGQFGTSVESQYDWFVIDEEDFETLHCGTTGFFVCDDGPGANLIDPRPLDSLAWWIAVDSFVSPNYGDGAIWTARRQLYRRLAASPEWVTTGSAWESFMNTHATSSVGVYEAIRQGWMVMPTGSDTMQSELSLATALQDSLIGSLSQIIETISETTDTSLLQTLITQQAQIETAIHANELELDSLYVDLVDLRNTHLLALSTTNAAASTSEDWTQAQQQANALMFKAAMQGIGVLDSTDKAQLELIADECPMILGEAVFQARGLLTSLDPGRNWDDASACIMAQPRYKEADDPLPGNMHVWPNPTRHTIFIDISEGTPQDWDITLYNAYGTAVKSWRYPSGLYQFELSELPSGVYTLQATGADGQCLNSRVFITR